MGGHAFRSERLKAKPTINYLGLHIVQRQTYLFGVRIFACNLPAPQQPRMSAGKMNIYRRRIVFMKSMPNFPHALFAIG